MGQPVRPHLRPVHFAHLVADLRRNQEPVAPHQSDLDELGIRVQSVESGDIKTIQGPVPTSESGAPS